VQPKNKLTDESSQLPNERSSEGAPVIEDGTEAEEVPRRGYINRGAIGFASPDEALQQSVSEALFADAVLGKTNLSVRVASGVVMLEGSMPSRADKARAVELTAQIPGVVKVDDRLSVAAPG
jgi:osmotically-inducible protein OsmY